MTVLRRQWNSLYISETLAAGMQLNSAAGGAWVRARKHAAHLVESALCARCGLADEAGASVLGVRTQEFSRPPTCAPSTQSVRQRYLPGTREHGSGTRPIPPLRPGKEAGTSDLITPRQGEHMFVGLGCASGYETDTRYQRVGTAAIIMDFPGTEWSDIENLPIQQLLNTTGPTQHSTDEDQLPH